jgi:hypothetical protein
MAAVLLLNGVALLAGEHKSGPAEFDAAGKKRVKVTVGKNIKFESDLHRFEFMGMTSVVGRGSLKNTSDKKLHASLHIAFFDKDKNLLGCGAQTFFAVMPGAQQFVNLVIGLPADVADQIASYQITLYEGEKQVGQK